MNNSVEKLGEEWGRLLNQAFVKILMLEEENRMLSETIRELNDRLNQFASDKDAVKDSAKP